MKASLFIQDREVQINLQGENQTEDKILRILVPSNHNIAYIRKGIRLHESSQGHFELSQQDTYGNLGVRLLHHNRIKAILDSFFHITIADEEGKILFSIPNVEISEHTNLRAFQDGDQIAIVDDNFINLQESPVYGWIPVLSNKQKSKQILKEDVVETERDY